MQSRPPPPPQVRDGHPANGLLEVTVTDRYVPLVTAAYGTRVARPTSRRGCRLATTAPTLRVGWGPSRVTMGLVGKPRSGAAATGRPGSQSAEVPAQLPQWARWGGAHATGSSCAIGGLQNLGLGSNEIGLGGRRCNETGSDTEEEEHEVHCESCPKGTTLTFSKFFLHKEGHARGALCLIR
jgi:hypothetical protein